MNNNGWLSGERQDECWMSTSSFVFSKLGEKNKERFSKIKASCWEPALVPRFSTRSLLVTLVSITIAYPVAQFSLLVWLKACRGTRCKISNSGWACNFQLVYYHDGKKKWKGRRHTNIGLKEQKRKGRKITMIITKQAPLLWLIATLLKSKHLLDCVFCGEQCHVHFAYCVAPFVIWHSPLPHYIFLHR